MKNSEEQKTEKQVNIQRRKDMESSVVAVNKYLVDKVTGMVEYELLANMHPLDAEFFTVRRFNTSNTL